MSVNISPHTIIFIIAYSFDLNRNYLEKEIEREDISDLSFFELLTFVFTKWTEKLIKEGLYKSFIDKTEQIKKVRGKILFQDYIKQGGVAASQLTCQFDDLSYNTLENQIILSTLLFCRQELNRIKVWFTSKRLEERERLNLSVFKLIRLLSPYIDAKPLSTGLFNQLLFHRMNIKYKSILSLCRFICHSTALKEIGEEEFLEPPEERMSEIFEGFLRNYLAEKLFIDQYSVNKKRVQDWIVIEESHGSSFFPEIRPDIIIWDTGVPRLIIDAKYYKDSLYKVEQFYVSARPDEERYKVHSHNLYQIIAYTSFFNCDGLLVYAQTEKGFFKGIGRIKPDYYLNKEINKRRLGFYTLDLTGDLDEFKTRMGEFVDMIKGYICESAN
ncbi:MAG: hypothetical protein HQ555_10320 [Candidatus Aminicenantes bacterium]|nr:hypothetical protein [Candidatus Aminicenantes bacterium]